MAQNGHTVVATIHQPSATLLSKFDRVILLADGKVCFCAPPEEIVKYYASTGTECPPNHNPADFLLEQVSRAQSGTTVSQNLISKLASEFKQSDLHGPNCIGQGRDRAGVPLTVLSYPEDRYPTSTSKQCTTLWKRSMKINFRDVLLVRARMGSHTVVGLILGGMFAGMNSAQRVFTSARLSCFFSSYLSHWGLRYRLC
eukprot:SAG11_NODE_794_length_7137_cov_45.288576_7_plen_199_part_00